MGIGAHRVELWTSCLSSKRSNQLSYAPLIHCWPGGSIVHLAWAFKESASERPSVVHLLVLVNVNVPEFRVIQ